VLGFLPENKMIVKQTFRWAHQGCFIKEYVAGEKLETDDEDLIRVAKQEGWVSDKPESKAVKSAPENK
jgi:hypothetical protein